MNDLFGLIDNLDDINTILKLQEQLRLKPFLLLTNNKDGFSPFTYALANKDLNIFRVLYNYYLQNKNAIDKSDFKFLDMRDTNKQRPIDIVVKLDNRDERLEKLTFLLENTDANLNLQDNYGNTPLHILTKKNDDAGVELIVNSKRANVNILNKSRQTPVYYAIRNKNPNILDLLIEANSILTGNVKDRYVNYRDMIVRSKNAKLIEYLMEYDKSSKKRLKREILKFKKKEYIRKQYKKLCSELQHDNKDVLDKFAKELNIDPSNKTKEELCSTIAKKVIIREYNPDLSFYTEY
jgi:ankyrin repeat protein